MFLLIKRLQKVQLLEVSIAGRGSREESIHRIRKLLDSVQTHYSDSWGVAVTVIGDRVCTY